MYLRQTPHLDLVEHKVAGRDGALVHPFQTVHILQGRVGVVEQGEAIIYNESRSLEGIPHPPAEI